ncbi:MAG: hypothetical protein SOR89_01120 [Ndongobacter sp.]|nr:hypothetical protein [Ndongobacter sp.]
MKKLVGLLLAFAMVLSLAACGGGNGNSQQSSAGGADKDSSESAAQSSQESSSSAAAGSDSFSLSETAIIDDDTCSFKVIGAEIDKFDGFVLNAVLENKLKDKTLSFALDDTTINGVRAFSFISKDVTPGNKANVKISFTTKKLEENGIKDFTDIELTGIVTETGNYDTLTRGTAHVYPYGEDKAVAYVRESKPTDVVLMDNDKVTVTKIGSGENDFNEFCISLYIVNKTDKKLSVSAADTAVNGAMLDPMLYENIPAGKSAFAAMSWSKSDLESNGITKIEKIEAPLVIKDYASYETLVTETVAIQP